MGIATTMIQRNEAQAMNAEQLAPRPESSRTDTVFVLLVLQAGFGVVSALATLAYARLGAGGIGMAIALLLGFGVPLLLLVLAAGIAGQKRLARFAVAGFETLVLLGAAVRLLVGRDMALGLVMLLTTIALPLAVMGLLFLRGWPHPLPSPSLCDREGDPSAALHEARTWTGAGAPVASSTPAAIGRLRQ